MQCSVFTMLFFMIATSVTLNACQKNTDGKTTNVTTSPSATLVGCYTVTKNEPAQIKINELNGVYSMQMREFNDPDKSWDKPESLQLLPTNELKSYFDVDERSIEKALIRPDKVFAVAKVQDSLMNLDSRFDSSYMGYIAKSESAKGSSNTIYKVDCGK